MGVRWVTGFLDTPSRAAEPFWQAVTGSRLSARRGPGGEFATLLPPGGDPYLRVQVVGDGPARAHLDLHVEQVAARARRAAALGAVVVHDEPDLVVLRSPAGLPFCLVAWQGEAVRPAGGRGLVDRIGLDVPAGELAAEADFWAALTEWSRDSDRLVGPAGMPLDLLLRPADAAAGMRVELTCADRAAEVAWHERCGARVLAVAERSTTLRDPAGRAYRVTDRR